MNDCNLIGRLTADPETRYSQGGTAFCSFTLAVDRPKKTQGQPDADFIRCKAFGKTAEAIGRYVTKGDRVGINGSIQTGNYTNQQGQKIFTTDIMVNHVDFLAPKKEQQGNWNGQSQQQSYYQRPNNYQQQPQQQWQQPAAYGQSDDQLNIDPDDLPF